MRGQVSEPYPSDVTDEEWWFVLPYLLLCREDSPQRKHDLRTVFNAVRYVARTGGQWRYLPHEFGPWWVVYQQFRRWLDAGVFEALVNARILPEWEDVRVVDMAKDPMAVEQWIKGLQTKPRTKDEKPRDLAPKSKLHTRAVMHRLFEYAMRWRYLDCQRNPMGLIELKGTSRRVRVIYLLTPQQYYVILSHLAPHVRGMVVLAMNTGLRISEILGLRWKDIDFQQATLTIERSVVGKYEDETKNLASASVLPLHELLIQELRGWQAREQNVNGWLFGNIDTGRPYHAASLRQDHLAPAGRKAGIPNLGWHNFRHTYRARLGSSGVAPEVQQKLMRHSSIDMTMRYGQNHMLDSTRPANAKLVEELLAAGALAAGAPLLRPQIS